MKTGRLKSEGGPDYNVQLWIDVGDYGHMPDAQMFNASQLKECLVTTSLPFQQQTHFRMMIYICTNAILYSSRRCVWTLHIPNETLATTQNDKSPENVDL